MKTILVPTDFSNAATNAAEYAVNLAKEMNAKVLLFHAYQMPIPISEVPIMIITPDELQKENETFLKKEAISLNQKSGVEVTYLAKMGMAVDQIIEEEKNVNLIVMGMKGASKLSEVLIGSVTTETLRRAKTPVLVIPEKVTYKTPENIVLACDYDPRTDVNILNVLKDFLKPFGSRIYVINAKHQNEPVSVDETKVGIQLEKELNDIEHFNYFLELDDIVSGINDFVESHNIDMIAIIPHRYSLMERLFHKSISKEMAFHTHVPLFALPDNHKGVPAYFL